MKLDHEQLAREIVLSCREAGDLPNLRSLTEAVVSLACGRWMQDDVAASTGISLRCLYDMRKRRLRKMRREHV